MPLKKSPSAAELASQQVAVRRASQSNLRASQSGSCNSAGDFTKMRRAQVEFQILALQSEIRVLDELKRVQNDDALLLETLHALLETEGDSKVTARKVYDGLRDIKRQYTEEDGEDAFRQDLERAIQQVEPLQDDLLDQEQFSTLVQKLVETLTDCTLPQLAELLVMAVLFSDRSLETEVTTAAKLQTVEQKQEHVRLLHDQRMRALFELFDYERNGKISFQEAVLGLYKLTDDMEATSKAAMNALMILDENDARALDFDSFAKLIETFVAAHPDHIKFDDIAGSLTKLMSEPSALDPESIAHLFTMDHTLKTVMDMSSPDLQALEKQHQDNKQSILRASVAASGHKLTRVELEKVNRLFDMWDLAKDGYVSSKELALALRKFQVTTSFHDTVKESNKIFDKFDHDADGRLNKQEFADFIYAFAAKTVQNVIDMVDYMIVTSALVKNTQAETAYIEKYWK